ncbi:MAG: Carbohydrate kinase PfkB family [Candidatus Tokpelaia sp. JSC161]|jgi:sugar/nucleoside kinase (ribokinase family)|nr:MAG: Carbohydrate kinase PfkB family [Candidatus Tokpelaia sp. JSC161]
MSRIHVLAIGNALVDIIIPIDDKFIINNDIIKGGMTLIENQQDLFNHKKAIISSGGSAANTIAALANFGSKTSFIGKIAEDSLGHLFSNDLQKEGVSYNTPPLLEKIDTGRSIIFITPDGERSMNTYLGASAQLNPKDIPVNQIENAQVTYLEGYLFDLYHGKEIIFLTAQTAHQHENIIAMSLSDTLCIQRSRKDFLHLIRNNIVDILFANEKEIMSLYKVHSIESALQAIRQDSHNIVCITRAEKGAIIIQKQKIINIPPFSCINSILDSTGAGDLYTAGFLYGYTHNFPLELSAKLGAFAGSLVIQQIGSRLKYSLRDAAIQKGLIESH